MRNLALLLSLFACVSQGRRVQTSQTLAADDELANLRKTLEDNKFKNIRALEESIDKELKAFMSDPSVEEFQIEARLKIQEKMKQFLEGNPKFKQIHEHTAHIDELYSELGEKVNAVNALAEEMSSDLPAEEQVKAIQKKPQFQAFEKQKKRFDEAIVAMERLPNYEQFQTETAALVEKEMEALRADPKFKKMREKEQHIDKQIEKLNSDPHLKEYQELMQKITQQTEIGIDPQSLAQVSQSSRKVDARDIFNPVQRLPDFVPALLPSSVMSPVVISELENSRGAWMQWERVKRTLWT